MPNIRFMKMVFAAAFLLAGLGAKAGPFTNGSFEIINHASIPAAEGALLYPGDTWLTGWTVGGPGGGDIEVANTSGDGINAYAGQQLALFNAGDTPAGGILSQTFTTTVGQYYAVSFAVAMGGSGGGVSLTATALAMNGVLLASNYCAPTSGVWVLCQMNFIAVSTNTTLFFTDTSSATAGVDLLFDDVTVTTNQAPSGPTIVTSPVSQSASSGTQATFTAAASGNPSGVQWYLMNYQGSNAIVGATNTTLTVTASGPAAGGYLAVFSNSAGSATTSTANLAVTGLAFTNGSFESPVVSGGQGMTAGTNSLPGWTVGGAIVGVWHGTTGGLSPYDGQQWLYFGGLNVASGCSVAQTITTVVGMPYVVTYYVGESGTGNLNLTGKAFDAVGNLLASNRCASVSGTWIKCQMSFTAATTNTTLAFTDTSVVDVQGGVVALDGVAVTANQPGNCQPPPQGLVSWWPGEANALDTWDGNNGTLAGAATYGPGLVGQGFLLAHAGDAVEVGSATNLQLQTFTIEGWIKRGSSSFVSLDPQGDGLFFGFGAGGYAFGLHSSGQLFLTRVAYDHLELTVAVTDTNFHHVAITKSGTTVVFYLDGIGSAAGSYGSTFSFTTAATIGAKGDTLGNSFYGIIDEMSVYNAVLSAAQIQAIYNAGSAGKCLPAEPPVILTQPANQTTINGGDAIFAVSTSGSTPLSYQWNWNGTNLSGATNASLLLTNVQFAQAGSYAVTVANVYGSIVSSNAVLAVNAGPPCTSPVSSLVSWWRGEENALDTWDGNNGTLAGAATYGPGLAGQGFLLAHAGDAIQVGFATNLQLQNFTIEGWIKRGSSSFVSLDPQGDGTLFGFGDRGYAFGLHSSGQLFLTRVDYDHVEATVAVTDTNFHHVAITKSGTTMVFYLDGVGGAAGSYGSTFTFTTAAAIGARGDTLANGFYGTIDEMSVYNGPLSAAQIQAIYNAGATGKCLPQGPPVILVQPANQSVLAGSTASFTVQASGARPMSFQWSSNGFALSGATNSALTLANVQPSQAASYSVTVSNALGVTVSSNAVLIVWTTPSITQQPQNQAVVAGGTATFSVGAAGSAPLFYQWCYEGTNIAGATGTSYSITNVGLTNVGFYEVVVTNSVGWVTSQAATLTINPLVTINGQAGPAFGFTNATPQVQITSTFSNATIFYTLDGSVPSFSSTLYTKPFILVQSAVVSAVAYDTNFNSVLSIPVTVAVRYNYALNVVNPGGGAVSLNPPGGVYLDGLVVQATATPSNGWTFMNWSGDATGTNPVNNVTMNSPRTVQAVFGTSLGVATPQNGTINCDPALSAYPYGSRVQLSAVPNPGYYFVLWGNAANGTASPFTLSMTNPAPSVSALFTGLGTNQVSLSVIPNGPGTVAVNPAGNAFTNGQVVALFASPHGGSQFTNWTGDASGTNDPLTVTMTSSKVITANFTNAASPIQFTVSLTGRNMVLTVTSPNEEVFDINVSSDLLNWSLFQTVTNTTGTAQVTVSPHNSRFQFYQAVSH